MNPNFRIAKKLALTVSHRFKMGAALYRGHTLIGTGTNNMDKSHPTMVEHAHGVYKEFIGSHAEFDCVRGLRPYDIGRRGKLFVYRHRRNGTQGLAAPCQACVGVLISKGIREVYFSKDDSGYGHIKL
jgi:deoxycytidylate deaminase